MLLQFYLALLPTAILGMLTAVKRFPRPVYLALAFVCVTFQSIVTGMRDKELGQDTVAYIDLFSGKSHFADLVEPGFMFLLWILRLFIEDPWLFLVVYALIMNYVLFLAYETASKGNGLFLFSLLSFTHVYWIVHVQLMRNGLAASLFLLSVFLYLNRRKFSSVFCALLASLFHYSVAFVLAVTLIGSQFIKVRLPRLVFGGLLGVALLYFISKILPSFEMFAPWFDRVSAYNQYNETLFGESSFGFQHFPLVIIITTFVYNRKKLRPLTLKLFLLYFLISFISFVFWSNLLFRDRFFLPAQLLEPVLLYHAMRLWWFNRVKYVVSATAFGCVWSLLMIFLWGSRNVLG